MNKLITLLIILLCSCSIEENSNSVNSSGKIVAFNGLGETLSIVDPLDKTINNDIALTGISPNHMVQDGEMLYLVNSLSNSLSIYSTLTMELLYEVYIGSGKNPWMVDFDSEMIYVTCFLTGELVVISKVSYEIISTIDVGITPQPVLVLDEFIIVGNTNYRGSTDSYDTGSLGIINRSSLTIDSEINLESLSGYYGINPQSMFYDSNRLFIICSGDYRSESDGLIFIYNLNDFTLEEVVEIGGSPLYSEGGIGGDRVYLGGIGSIRSFSLSSYEVYEPMLFSSSDFIPSVIYYNNYIYSSMFNRDELYIFEDSLDSRIGILQGSDGIQQLLYIKE